MIKTYFKKKKINQKLEEFARWLTRERRKGLNYSLN
jgi:hypothetical protein